jgi:hypothetical protein
VLKLLGSLLLIPWDSNCLPKTTCHKVILQEAISDDSLLYVPYNYLVFLDKRVSFRKAGNLTFILDFSEDKQVSPESSFIFRRIQYP